MVKRKIFRELMEGVDAMKKHREGKRTRRSYKEEVMPLPAVDSKFIGETRKGRKAGYPNPRSCINE